MISEPGGAFVPPPVAQVACKLQLLEYEKSGTDNFFVFLVVCFYHLANLCHLPSSDPRFAKNDDRMVNWKLLQDIFEEKLAARTSEEWTQYLQKNKIAAGPCLTVPEVCICATVIGMQ